jgi:hypothetical protein
MSLKINKFERTVRRTLRQLARQRVRVVLQPGSIWIIDKAINETADTHAALLTCFMRGWVEPLENAVPSAKLLPGGKLPPDLRSGTVRVHYRLTSAGWSVIHRSSFIAACALLISVLSFFLTVAVAQVLQHKGG